MSKGTVAFLLALRVVTWALNALGVLTVVITFKAIFQNHSDFGAIQYVAVVGYFGLAALFVLAAWGIRKWIAKAFATRIAPAESGDS